MGTNTHDPTKNYANLRIAGTIRSVLQSEPTIEPLSCYADDLWLVIRLPGALPHRSPTVPKAAYNNNVHL